MIPILSSVEYHKDLFLVHCFSYYILMTCLTVICYPEYVMYADDTNLTYASANQTEIFCLLNRDLETIHERLKANKLSLNITKTKYMLTGTHQKVSSMQTNLNISLDGKLIERKRLFKRLGVNLDEILSWELHVKSISKKIAKVLGVLRRLRPYVTQDILIIIYKSLILPHFDYCSEVWGNLGKTLAADLQKLQNRTARIITSSSYEIRSDNVLAELNWKKLNERRHSQLASMMYKCTHNKVPVYLSDIFSTTS